MPGFFFTLATKDSSVSLGLAAGTKRISGSTVTRAIAVNCSFFRGVRPCAISASVELVPIPMV